MTLKNFDLLLLRLPETFLSHWTQVNEVPLELKGLKGSEVSSGSGSVL